MRLEGVVGLGSEEAQGVVSDVKGDEGEEGGDWVSVSSVQERVVRVGGRCQRTQAPCASGLESSSRGGVGGGVRNARARLVHRLTYQGAKDLSTSDSRG